VEIAKKKFPTKRWRVSYKVQRRIEKCLLSLAILVVLVFLCRFGYSVFAYTDVSQRQAIIRATILIVGLIGFGFLVRFYKSSRYAELGPRFPQVLFALVVGFAILGFSGVEPLAQYVYIIKGLLDVAGIWLAVWVGLAFILNPLYVVVGIGFVIWIVYMVRSMRGQ